MLHRIYAALREITVDVHKRRVRQWAESNEGSFPNLAESGRQAVAELALLCAALGPLVAITPAQFEYAAGLYERVTWKGTEQDYRNYHFDFDLPADWNPFEDTGSDGIA